MFASLRTFLPHRPWLKLARTMIIFPAAILAYLRTPQGEKVEQNVLSGRAFVEVLPRWPARWAEILEHRHPGATGSLGATATVADQARSPDLGNRARIVRMAIRMVQRGRGWHE